MRRAHLLLFLTALVLLCSCEIGFLKISMPDTGKNPFWEPIAIYDDDNIPDEIAAGGVIRFIALSDAHFGRKGVDSNVSYNNENFFTFLSNAGRIDFFAFTGDMLDAFSEGNARALSEFVEEIRTAARSNPGINPKAVYVPGNHDFENSSPAAWTEAFGADSFFPGHGTMASYRIGNVAIYKTDSAYRVFGGAQLSYLDEAMEASDARYNLVLNHVPLGADTIDQTLFEFVIADANERNLMLKILSVHKPSLVLSGHHHKGNILNTWSDSVHELVLAAYHRRDMFMDLESKGYWYLVEIDQSSGKVTVEGYRMDDIGKPDKTYSFFME